MIATELFRREISKKMDYQCMATQDAIDRVASEFGGRQGLLGWLAREAEMPSVPWSGTSFTNAVLSAWKDRDLVLATGRGRDYWASCGD